jgi:hypothetical protein
MNIPLDDLLPTSDASFEPVDSAEYFTEISPFWEFSDMHKWWRPLEHEPRRWFRVGYYAALFECLLKSGKPFRFPIDRLPETMFWGRAQRMGRTVRYTSDDAACQEIVVSGHEQVNSECRCFACRDTLVDRNRISTIPEGWARVKLGEVFRLICPDCLFAIESR